MKLLINRYMSDVTEISLTLDQNGWSQLVDLIKNLQDDGLCLKIDVTSMESFTKTLNSDPENFVILFEKMRETELGEEASYVDSTNEDYEAFIEK